MSVVLMVWDPIGGHWRKPTVAEVQTWMVERAAPAQPYQPHSATSREAARQIAPSSETLRQQVYQYLLANPAGATDEEIQRALGMNPNTERPRRRELQQAGWVVDSGHRRKTSSGRQAVVWIPIRGETRAPAVHQG